MERRHTLPLHYRVLAWALLPMLALNGFALLHTSRGIDEARAALEAESAQLEGRIQQEFGKQLETLSQVAKLLADSEELAEAVGEHRSDWLYQWSHRFIRAGLAGRITIADADGLVIARGHDEFAFGDSIAGHRPFRVAIERGGFTGALELDSIPSLVAIEPIYRYDTLFSGVVIVSHGLTLGMLKEIETHAAGRLGITADGRRIGHFPAPTDPDDRLVHHFPLHLPTLSDTPLWVTHEQDLGARIGALRRLGNRLLAFSVVAIGLVVPLVVLSMGRILRPLRSLHEQLARFSHHEIDLDDLIERVGPLQRSGGELGAIATSVADGLRELRRTQLELSASEQRAREANRAKSEFLANMSHEIRTPINAVIGFTELLERSELDAVQRDYLQSVKSGGNSLLTLINDILDLSKIEAGALRLEYVPVSLRGLFAEIERIFRRRIEEKQLSLILDVDPETPERVLLDEVRLRQVLLNLVGNAVKFTDFGTIQLTAEAKPAGEGQVDLLIAVCDSGIGIAAVNQEKVFEAFEQSDGHSTRRYGGTGLGLAISRKLVEMMEGTISLSSVPGKGSAFVVALHGITTFDALSAEADLEEEPPRRERLHLEPCTVLAVDDVPSNRELIRVLLEESGATVVTAEDGREALEAAARHRPALILMDLKMPGMDGYEAVHRLRADPQLAGIPVVAVTASVNETERARIGHTGFDGQLHKPLIREEVHHLLRHFLPHHMESGDAEEEEPADDTLPAATAARLPELLAELDALRQELPGRGGGNLAQLRELSRKFQRLAERYPAPPLQRYANQLSDALAGFDIERIERTLGRLPRLTEQLRPAPPAEQERP
ncbi:ATP-binding protein [Endothiovibrio diazotrophicus]